MVLFSGIFFDLLNYDVRIGDVMSSVKAAVSDTEGYISLSSFCFAPVSTAIAPSDMTKS